jgi:AraC family transcriptional regulator
MLTTSHKPVTSIALEVGFYDHSAFSRKFSALIGESPSAYRNRYQRKKLGGDRPG